MNQRIINSLEVIRDHVFNGWVGLVLAQESLNVLEVQEFALFKNILNIIHFTNAEYTLLEISNISTSHSDSINLNYLLNLIEEEARLTDNTRVSKYVIEHRKRIKEYKEIIDLIITHRDKRIAHLDRLLLDKTKSQKEIQPINMEKVEEVYTELEKIINSYCYEYKINGLNIISYELAVHKEWGFMLERLLNNKIET